MKPNLLFIIIVLFCSFENVLFAQNMEFKKKNEIINLKTTSLEKEYAQMFSEKNLFASGKLYYHTRHSKFIHPFYLNYNWLKGGVVFNSKLYNVDKIKYDIHNDNLICVVISKGYAYPISLNKNKVHEFYISGHHFKYLEDFNSISINKLVPGYYEIIYNNKTSLLIKWKKELYIHDIAQLEKFRLTKSIFLEKDNKFFIVRNLSGLLKLLKERKKELKTFIRKNKLAMRRDIVKVFSELLVYYDSLN